MSKFEENFQKAMSAAASSPRIAVLYYTAGTLHPSQGPAARFATIGEAAKDIRRNFDNRFYDEAHVTEIKTDQPIAHVHRFRKDESRWLPGAGRRPATLARYFDPDVVAHRGVVRIPVVSADLIIELGRKLPYTSGGQGVLSVGTDLESAAHRAAYNQEKLVYYNWPIVARTYLHFAKNPTHPPERRKIYRQVYDILVHTDYGDGKSPAERLTEVGK